MIIDLLQNIVGYSKSPNQIKCSMLNNCTYDNIYIYALDVGEYRINQKLIEQKKFSKLKKLVYKHNDTLNLDHLSDTLIILYMKEYDPVYSIKQEGISKLKKLRALICPDNMSIYDVNHLADTLVCLDCRGVCGINQQGISKLNKVEILYCTYNEFINNVNHLADTLEHLHCGETCGIDQNGISQLKKLSLLDCSDNKKINDVNHLADTLIELDCSGNSGIGKSGISELKHLKELRSDSNENFCTRPGLSCRIKLDRNYFARRQYSGQLCQDKNIQKLDKIASGKPNENNSIVRKCTSIICNIRNYFTKK